MEFTKNNVKFDYSEEFIQKVRAHLGRSTNELVTEQEMVDFFTSALSTAVNKGYGVVDESIDKPDKE